MLRNLLILFVVLLAVELLWKNHEEWLPDFSGYFDAYFNKPEVLMPFCSRQPNNAETRFIQRYIPSYADQIGCSIANRCIVGGKGHYSVTWGHTCNFQGHLTDSATFVCQKKDEAGGKVCCEPAGYGYMFMGCE